MLSFSLIESGIVLRPWSNLSASSWLHLCITQFTSASASYLNITGTFLPSANTSYQCIFSLSLFIWLFAICEILHCSNIGTGRLDLLIQTSLGIILKPAFGKLYNFSTISFIKVKCKPLFLAILFYVSLEQKINSRKFVKQ